MKPQVFTKALALLVIAFVLSACSPSPIEEGPDTPGGGTSPADKPPADKPGTQKPAPGVPPSQSDYVPDELLVRFEPSTPEDERRRVRARHNLAKLEDFSVPGLELDRILDGGRPPDRAKEVSAEPSVRYAEPNGIVRIQR